MVPEIVYVCVCVGACMCVRACMLCIFSYVSVLLGSEPTPAAAPPDTTPTKSPGE